MSSIPFERYDDEFHSLTVQVQESLRQMDEEKGIEFAHSLLSQCDDLLKQMAIEARGVEDASLKRDLLLKVRTCKSQLAALRTEYEFKLSNSQKESLLKNSTKNSHKERLLENEQRMEQQNATLERARSVMADTEEVALEITTELGRNREVMETSHARVKQVSGLTNRARRILQNMNLR
jgi:vesicle transport through interaction with t-SNAREs 1